MANKIFSFYTNNGHHSATDGDQLIIETGRTHFACMVRNEGSKHITALEWFKHEAGSGQNFGSYLKEVEGASKLLDKYYSKTNLFINNECSVLVPRSKFSKEVMEDYLDSILGKSLKNTSMVDEIEEGGGIVNCFRIQTDVLDLLNKYLQIDKVEHTYSRALRHLLSQEDLPALLMKVQFYDSDIILAVVNNGKLQFMQSFTYQSPEDVLYYLLSTSQRLLPNTDQLVLKVSGMVDMHSHLYSLLRRYFKSVSVETVLESIVEFETGDYPTHYFTPTFNLAL